MPTGTPPALNSSMVVGVILTAAAGQTAIAFIVASMLMLMLMLMLMIGIFEAKTRGMNLENI